MDVYINGQRTALNPKNSVGKGGEADVFKIGNGKVLKLFKSPSHPDYLGMSAAQLAAKFKLEEHQKKLRAFPKNLPARVITPLELAMDKSNANIVGYTMRYLKDVAPLFQYAQKSFRQLGISNEAVVKIFTDLFRTVQDLHAKKIVIGDFNDLNVLVKDEGAYVIDADSFQFADYYCRMFTVKFLDPLLCDPKANEMALAHPYQQESDWYAYSVMLMQCLLFVDPYGGIYRPKDKSKKANQTERRQKRITIFDPEVMYPKPAVHYKILPDDMLHYLHGVFVTDQRGLFPKNILENMRWTKCTVCGMEHARSQCPECLQVAPAAIKQTVVVRGNVVSTLVFKTDGQILFAAYQEKKLKWLHYEKEEFKREDGSVVLEGKLDPRVRYRLQGNKTLLGKNGQVVILKQGAPAERIATDSYGILPVFDANENNRFFIQNEQLVRDGRYGNEYIGGILANQTLFWVGAHFGFGLYRAGNLNVAFVFDADRSGINDNVKLPKLRGQLLDSTCFFTEKRCWFMASLKDQGKIINHCVVILRTGEIEASCEYTLDDENDWLSVLRGKCVAGNFLLAATDEGIVKVEVIGNKIAKTKTFPDTEPFVDTSCHLFLSQEGLYVVSQKEIKLLKIA